MQPLPGDGFYAILDTGYVPGDRLPDVYLALLNGGAVLVQLRAKEATTQQRIQILDTLVKLSPESSVPLVVNDDIDAALAFPRIGLHVGQDDLPVAQARERLGPERILGLSTHSPAQAAEAITQASLLSYFAVGPVFATPTKPDYTPVGLELVRHVAGLNPPLPWFAIGGIKLHNAEQVIAAGVRGLVAVTDVLLAEDPAAVVTAYADQLAKV
ncbi:MAG: thiamine phosphate synthase [Verrucomicrobiota bacterium]